MKSSGKPCKWPGWLPATKSGLKSLEEKIETLMSQITDWAAQEEADITEIKGTLDGIVAGIAALDDIIIKWQNSPGTLSTADQAALDNVQSLVKDLKAKSAAISTTP